MNVLCLGSEIVGDSVAAEHVATFLRATFIGESCYLVRLQKIGALEKETWNG